MQFFFFVIGKECFLCEVRAEAEGISDNLGLRSESVLCEVRAEAQEIFVKDEHVRHQFCCCSME
jgi:hypothetical protein